MEDSSDFDDYPPAWDVWSEGGGRAAYSPPEAGRDHAADAPPVEVPPPSDHVLPKKPDRKREALIGATVVATLAVLGVAAGLVYAVNSHKPAPVVQPPPTTPAPTAPSSGTASAAPPSPSITAPIQKPEPPITHSHETTPTAPRPPATHTHPKPPPPHSSGSGSGHKPGSGSGQNPQPSGSGSGHNPQPPGTS